MCVLPIFSRNLSDLHKTDKTKENTFLPHEKTELTNVHLYNIQQKITSVHSGSEYFSKLLPTYIYEMNEVCKE